MRGEYMQEAALLSTHVDGSSRRRPPPLKQGRGGVPRSISSTIGRNHHRPSSRKLKAMGMSFRNMIKGFREELLDSGDENEEHDDNLSSASDDESQQRHQQRHQQQLQLQTNTVEESDDCQSELSFSDLRPTSGPFLDENQEHNNLSLLQDSKGLSCTGEHTGNWMDSVTSGELSDSPLPPSRPLRKPSMDLMNGVDLDDYELPTTAELGYEPAEPTKQSEHLDLGYVPAAPNSSSSNPAYGSRPELPSRAELGYEPAEPSHRLVISRSEQLTNQLSTTDEMNQSLQVHHNTEDERLSSTMALRSPNHRSQIQLKNDSAHTGAPKKPLRSYEKPSSMRKTKQKNAYNDEVPPMPTLARAISAPQHNSHKESSIKLEQSREQTFQIQTDNAHTSFASTSRVVPPPNANATTSDTNGLADVFEMPALDRATSAPQNAANKKESSARSGRSHSSSRRGERTTTHPRPTPKAGRTPSRTRSSRSTRTTGTASSAAKRVERPLSSTSHTPRTTSSRKGRSKSRSRRTKKSSTNTSTTTRMHQSFSVVEETNSYRRRSRSKGRARSVRRSSDEGPKGRKKGADQDVGTQKERRSGITTTEPKRRTSDETKRRSGETVMADTSIQPHRSERHRTRSSRRTPDESNKSKSTPPSLVKKHHHNRLRHSHTLDASRSKHRDGEGIKGSRRHARKNSSLEEKIVRDGKRDESNIQVDDDGDEATIEPLQLVIDGQRGGLKCEKTQFVATTDVEWKRGTRHSNKQVERTTGKLNNRHDCKKKNEMILDKFTKSPKSRKQDSRHGLLLLHESCVF